MALHNDYTVAEWMYCTDYSKPIEMSACLMSLSSLGLSNKNLSKGLGDFLSVAIAPYDDHYMIVCIESLPLCGVSSAPSP